MSFIKRQLATSDCTYLKKCCVDQRIIGQVKSLAGLAVKTVIEISTITKCLNLIFILQIESALEECISTGTYLDASTILPSIMSEDDVADIIAVVLKPNKQKSTQLFGTTSN